MSKRKNKTAKEVRGKPRKRRRARCAAPPSGGCPGLVRTLSRVAAHFGVAERTAANWRARGMPGKPGAYDLAAIAAWRDAQVAGRAASSEAGSELAKVEVELRRLKLAREQGGLVSVAVAARLFRRHIHEAKAQLAQLPDEVLAELADAVPRDRLAELAARIRGRIDGACRSLADLLAAEELAISPATEE